MEHISREKHLLKKIMIMMLAFCAVFIEAGDLKKVQAAEWYENYNYETDPSAKTLTIKASKGTLGTTATVPGSTTIQGVTYTTVLNNSGNGLSIWDKDKSTLTSITIGNGVKVAAGSNSLFRELSNLQTIDLAGLDTSDMTDMSYMFYNCSELLYLDTSKFNTSKVTNMDYMFYGCKKLIYIDVSSFNTNKVDYMQYMFEGSFGDTMLQDLDLRSFNMNKGTTTFTGFLSKAKIVNLYLPKTNCIKNYDMSGMSNLARIYYGGSSTEWAALNNTYGSGVNVICDYTQQNTPSEPQVENPDTSTWYNNYNYFLDKKHFKIHIMSAKDTDMTSTKIPAYTVIGGNTYRTVINSIYARKSTPTSLWANVSGTIKNITINDGVEFADISNGLFRGLHLNTLEIGTLSTSNVVSMKRMFSGTQINTLDLRGLDMSNANIGNMFTSIDSSTTNINKLILPVNAMKGCNMSSISGLTNIYYVGTQSQWTALGNTTGSVSITYNYAGLPDAVKVTLNPNGGNLTTDSLMLNAGAEYGTLPIPTRSGYTFVGWYTALSGGEQVTATSIVNNSSDHTLYARWTNASTKVTVTFNANSGTVSPTSTEVTVGVNYGALPTPTRSGYTFDGWYTAASGGDQVTAATVVENSSSHTLYAHWISSGTTTKVTVTFNANGGSVSTTSKEVTVGENYGTLPTPTKSGYTFDGWYTAATNGTKITATSKVGNSSNHTLYAVWTTASSSQFTVTLDPNGGVVSKDSITVETGKVYSTLPTPTRDGYSFNGWYTAQTGGTKVTFSTTVTETKPHTLYAQWTAKPITVSFDANGGSVSISGKQVTVGAAYGTLPTPTRTGYSFVGWYTSATDGSNVTEETIVTNSSSHKLYANWTENEVLETVTVSLNTNGGNSISPDSIEVTAGETYGTLPTPTRNGYKFEGWYSAVTGGEKVTASTVLLSNSAHTLYARWTEIVTKVTVTLNANGGTVASGSVELTIGGSYGKLPEPTRDGYTFGGWFTSASGGTEIKSTTSVNNSSPHTIYAHWTKIAIQVEVSFNANNGTVSQGSKTVTVGEIYGSLPTPTRDGYSFAGWYTEVDGNNVVTQSTKVTETKPHALYAHWTPKNISVTFNANGGNITTSSKQYTVGGTYENMPTPTRDGYNFDGWFTASSGGDKISESAPITKTVSHTLYAHWTAKAITVTFNANGGTVSDESKTVTVNSTYGTLPTATRTGYNFKGWFTSASGGTQISATSTVSIKSAHTLYAQWTEIKVTVTFNANGGSVGSTAKTVTVGQAYGSLPTPSRTNYRFDGWYTDITDGTKVETTTNVSETTAHTLYAHWTLTNVTVTFSGNGEGSSISKTSAVVTIGSTYGSLPTATRNGYDILGWFTAAEGGEEVGSSTIVEKTTAHTLYAHWKKKVITMQVTFNANGGSLAAGDESKQVTNGSAYGTLPTPNRDGYTFDGWYTSASGNIEVKATDTVEKTTAHTLYAHWTKDIVIVNVILNPNGGSLKSGNESVQVTYGNSYGTLPQPDEREDYTFDGWFTAAEGGTEIKSTTVVNNQTTHTIYAHWKKKVINVTVSFAPTGGSVSTTSKTVTYTGEYGALPTPSKNGYEFKGWYTEPNGGTPVTADTLVDYKVSHTLYAQWTEKKVIVDFDVNGEGAVIDGDDSKEVAVVGKYGTLPTANMTGYNFEGWYSEKTGGTQVTADTSVIKNSNHTLYAQWTKKQTVDDTKVNITLNPNGGLLSGKTDKTTIKAIKGAEYGSLPEPVKDGYDFVGWLRKADGTLVTTTTAALSEEHELVAQWTKKVIVVNVTYNANGGSLTETGKSVTVGQSYGTLPKPSMSGYIFDGWYTSVSGGEAVTATTTVQNTGDHTLYARWIEDKKEINVTFNAGEGSVTTLSKTVTYLDVYGELPKPTRENCDFIGWFTEAEAGVEITATSKVEISEAHTLYAHWKEKVWVVFNANEGKVDTIGVWVTVSEKYGELPDAVRDGYAFDGWFTEADGGTEITENSTVTAAGSHTLFAHWTEIDKKVTVTFNPNEGSIDADKVSAEVTVGKTYGTLPTVTREGYEFKGWYTDVESGELISSTSNVVINTSHTLYAHWYEENKKVTVTFNANGGTVESGKETVEYVVGEYYDNLPVPSKDGYVFEGWYLESTFETAVNTNTIVKLETAHALYARWSEKIKTVSVSFNANGGNITTNSMIFTVGDRYENLPTPVMTGYIFDGWYTDIEDGVKVTVDMVVENEDAHSLFAHWTAKEKKVTVAFNVNGGIMVGDGNVELTVGGTYGDLPIPTKNDFIFDGWYTELEGGDKVTSNTVVENEDAHSLYAHWIDKITVTLNANGGTINVDSFTVTYNGKYDSLSSLPDPVKSGCNFEGWYTDATEGTRVTADTVVTTKESHTIYAHWTGDEYIEDDDDGLITVSLNANGGTVTPESIIVTVDEAYGDLPTPEKDGYVFLGWYITEGGEYITPDSVVNDAYAHTLYALWADNTVTISFNANGGRIPEGQGNKVVTIGQNYGVLPSATRAGYVCSGWYTEAVGGEKIYLKKKVELTASHTVYAQWIKQDIKTTVHFDANEGSVEETSREVSVGEPYGELPVPTREGLYFAGWYTELEDGVQITAESEVDRYEEHTLYAHWTTEAPIDPNDPTSGETQSGTGDTPEGNTQTPADTGNGGQTTTQTGTTTTSVPAVNTVISEPTSGVSYKVSDSTPEASTVVYMGSNDKKVKTVTVPDTVVIEGQIYKVTKVDASAFNKNTNVTKIIIGKNVTTLGKNVFKKCKKVKTIIFKTTKLTNKSVAKGAFKGVTKKTVIKVPKKKFSAYKKLFRKKGLSKKVKIKKS